MGDSARMSSTVDWSRAKASARVRASARPDMRAPRIGVGDQLHGRPRPRRAHVDGPAERLQHRHPLLGQVRLGADEDLQGAVGGLGDAAQHGGVDHVDVVGDALGQLADHVGAHRRHLDQGVRRRRHPLHQPARPEDDLLQRLRGGEHGEHRLRLAGRLGRGADQAGAPARRGARPCPGVRFHTTRSWPASSRRPAMGRPIWPRPTNARVVMPPFYSARGAVRQIRDSSTSTARSISRAWSPSAILAPVASAT